MANSSRFAIKKEKKVITNKKQISKEQYKILKK